MLADVEENCRLLQDQADIGSKESTEESNGPSFDQEHKNLSIHRWQASYTIKNILILSLVLSVATNLVLAAFLTRKCFSPTLATQALTNSDHSTISPYAGISRDESVRFPYSTGYGPEVTNHSLLDERWEAIDIDSGVVAISDEWATEHNLAPTQRFPWDASKGVYLLTAFHTLHCLKNIHRILYDAHHGRPLSRNINHALHCVDHMRKDAMCEADDFLLPSPKSLYGSPGPRGQSRVCKDWDALVAWAQDHDACYQHISDDEEGFAAEHDELERYGACPPTSPYFKTMQEHLAVQ